MTILGLDIGGANIKAADEAGLAISRPFAIWRYPERLKDEIAVILGQFPHIDQVAVTMTAELADCFETKAEGVRFILDEISSVVDPVFSDTARSDSSPGHANQSRPVSPSPRLCGERGWGEGISPESSTIAQRDQNRSNRPSVTVWTTLGRFVDISMAREIPEKIAAANWHALATWCGQFAPTGSALLVDIGTTTTDVIPLLDGVPASQGLTDLGRLQNGELSYSGIRRTPLCAIAHSVPLGDGYCPVAAELFATTLDVHLLTGEIPEDTEDCDTANGKPATKTAAYDRIARMLCCDRNEVSFDESVHIARFLADVQRQRLAGSLDRVVQRLPSPCQTIIVAGTGSFLARRLVSENRNTKDATIVLLAQQLSPGIAESACAYAVAKLARHRVNVEK